MGGPKDKSTEELSLRLKWLMLFRLVFTSFLLGATILLQLRGGASPTRGPLLIIYCLVAGTFLLSTVYVLILKRTGWIRGLTLVQIFGDSILISIIIIITGGFSSVFSFLYLLVIIYASILLYRRGGFIAAMMCSIQYAGIIALDYYGFLLSLTGDGVQSLIGLDSSEILYKSSITIVACFVVAFLSGLLSDQVRKSSKKILAMEDHFRRVQKMASLGEMAAGLAHEIKNPLASLAGAIQLLKGEIRCSPDQDRLMQIVLRETDRLNNLVNNFLLFARPPTGNAKRIRLDNALGEIITLFENDRAILKDIVIVQDLIEDIWVEIDPVHLHQVIWNLLLNAAHAIDNKGRIIIRMYSLRKQIACIEIIDNGHGMADETIASIFDPFFTTKPDGTGLGLSIVHRILETYHSHLEVESRIDQGTTFKMTLKRSLPQNPPMASVNPKR
jgi:two-component system sensor histidine kinase PilS (NtrC family)